MDKVLFELIKNLGLIDLAKIVHLSLKRTPLDLFVHENLENLYIHINQKLFF